MGSEHILILVIFGRHFWFLCSKKTLESILFAYVKISFVKSTSLVYSLAGYQQVNYLKQKTAK